MGERHSRGGAQGRVPLPALRQHETGSQEHCPIAQEFYEICKVYGTALMLSRCAVWKEKPGETYHPLTLDLRLLDIQAAPLNADAMSQPIPITTRLLVPQSNVQLPYRAPTIDCEKRETK